MAISDWLTRDTMCGLPIDDLLSYKTVKVVRIQDRALGIVALVLQLATVIFIVFNLILGQEKGYLKYEPVTGTVGGQLIGTVQGLNTSSLSYCQDGSVCRFLDMFSIVAADPEPSSIFISTYMREHRQKRVCDVDADVCDRHSPFETVATREYFVAGVEEYNVLVSHDAQATQMFLETRDERYRGDQSTMSGTLQKYMDDGTGRVRLMVTRTFEEGKPILLSVGELLASAGLSFDSVLPGYFAPIRKSGVHINCYITYSNTWNWLSPAPSIQYSLEVFPGVQIKKRFDEPVGFGDERMLIERVGMRVSFKQDGQLGSFSLLAFFRTLTVGMMIFALITWSLDIVCTRFMPVSHKYEEAKYEFTENIYNLRESLNLSKDRMYVGGVAVSGVPLSGRAEGSQRNMYSHRSETGVASARTPAATSRGQYGALNRGEGEGQRPPPMYPDGGQPI